MDDYYLNTHFACVFCTPYRGLGGEHTGERGNTEFLRIARVLNLQINLSYGLIRVQ